MPYLSPRLDRTLQESLQLSTGPREPAFPPEDTPTLALAPLTFEEQLCLALELSIQEQEDLQGGSSCGSPSTELRPGSLEMRWGACSCLIVQTVYL